MNFNSLKKLSLLSLIALYCATLSAAQPLLSKHIPKHLDQAQRLGDLETNLQLHLAISLPLQHTNALAQTLANIYDPQNPQFHHYLAPAQFNEQFGPSRATYAALENFCQERDLTIEKTHGNRAVLLVSGSVGRIQKAFHVKMGRYQYENRICYAPENEPTNDFSEPLLHIEGLNNLNPPHPHNTHTPMATSAFGTNGTGSAPYGLYGGRDFRNAYLPGVNLAGEGQSVALVQFDGFYSNDITLYLKDMGLTPVPLVIKLMDQFDGTPGASDGEVALDIECVNAMAPGLDQIIVYEGGPNGSPDDLLAQVAQDDSANQISCSWTWAQNDDPSVDQSLQQMAAQGQSYFNAAGDNGAYPAEIDKPADCVYASVVGGTSLNVGTNTQNWAKEYVWNTNGMATGGGISTDYLAPVWQTNIATIANKGSYLYRNLPDISLIANQVLSISENGGTYETVGTSIASPLWAALTAIINEKAASQQKGTVGFINPALYALGKSANSALIFHDITLGNNGLGIKSYPAIVGYDLCTGWGTPTGSNTINALVCQLNAGQIDHYDLNTTTNNPMYGPNYPGYAIVCTGFNLTISAKTYGGLAATNYNGTLTLNAALQTTNVANYQGFETGNLNGWTNGSGYFLRVVDSTTGAAGTSNSFKLVGGDGSTSYNGSVLPLSNCQPQHIQFYIKTMYNNLYGGYFVVGNGNARTNSLFHFHLDATGSMGLVDFSGNTYYVPYTSNQWYKVRIDVHWTNKTLDFLVDDKLITPHIGFCNSNINSLVEAQVYNLQGTIVWYDEIRCYDDPTDQPITITPSTVNCINGLVNSKVQISTGGSNVILTATDNIGNSGIAPNLYIGYMGAVTCEANPTNAGYIWVAGIPYTGRTISLVAVTTNDNYRFVGWNNGNTNTEQDVIVPIGPTNLVAEFQMYTSPPTIYQQPVNTTINAGETASFTINAYGGALTYRWETANQTNDLSTGVKLTLQNVQLNQGTNRYCCVVANSAASVTSQWAQVILRPQVATLTQGQNGFQINLAKTPGTTCYIQASTNLTDWVTISTNTSGNFVDTNKLSHRYYRLAQP